MFELEKAAVQYAKMVLVQTLEQPAPDERCRQLVKVARTALGEVKAAEEKLLRQIDDGVPEEEIRDLFRETVNPIIQKIDRVTSN